MLESIMIGLLESIMNGLHQEQSALSQLLFVILMDEFTRLIQDEIFWYILFVDDIALINEMRAGKKF